MKQCLQSVENQIPLHQAVYQGSQITNPQWTPELTPSPFHGVCCPMIKLKGSIGHRSIANIWLCFLNAYAYQHLPLTIRTEHNLGQDSQAHYSPSFPSFSPVSIDDNGNEVGFQDVFETGTMPRSKKPHRRYTEDEKNEIREFHKNNPDMSYSMIGDIFGCSKSTAHRIINREDASDSATG